MTLGDVVVGGNVCFSCSWLFLALDQLLFKEVVEEEGGWPCLCWTGKRLSPPCHRVVEGHPFLPHMSVRSNIHSQV